MLRNIKRERYAKKELEKLKQVVALAEKDKDADMKDLYTGKTTTINDIASFIVIHDCTLYVLTVDCFGQLITVYIQSFGIFRVTCVFQFSRVYVIIVHYMIPPC